MKETFIDDLLHSKPGTPVVLPCWLAAKQRHGGILFLTLHDSSGNIQAIAEKENIDSKTFDELKRVPLESGVVVYGTLVTAPNDGVEIQLQKLEMVGSATQQFCPQPRSDIDIFSPSLTNHLRRRFPRLILLSRKFERRLRRSANVTFGLNRPKRQTVLQVPELTFHPAI